jgi:hypothetical protein
MSWLVDGQPGKKAYLPSFSCGWRLMGQLTTGIVERKIK